MSDTKMTEFTNAISALHSSNIGATVTTFTKMAEAAPQALTILAEGDSWFAYPRDSILWGKNANIIHWLKNNPKLVIHATATNGDEAVNMMSGVSKFGLLKEISVRTYDVLLFSGGGNDIVGAYDFDFFLRDRQQVSSWQDGIDMDRFTRRLASVVNSYEDLLDYAEEYSKNKNIVVVTHTYDSPVPNPKGASFVGGLLKYDGARSWMYPYLMAKHFTDRQEQINISTYMLNQLAEKLLYLSDTHKGRLVVVNTQGQLGDHEWLNEIHPDSTGFQRIADKIFFDALEPLYNRKNGTV